MSTEIRDLRAKWQNFRQALLRADYNHADEQLARVLYFADHSPLIAGILHQIRSTPMYIKFDVEKWYAGRHDADVIGAGNTSLGFSLDESECTAQYLKVLEMTVQRGEDSLWTLGTKTFGGGSTKIIDYVHSAIEVFFEPFYRYIDDQLRSMESLITPTDMMSQFQSLVDGTTSIRYPLTHKLLTDTYRLLFTLTAESTGISWNKIGYSCRDVLLQFANEVFDPNFLPSNQDQPKGDEAKTKLNNTVRYFLKNDEVSDQYREVIEKIVQANWGFVNSVGHRQKSATESDARLAVTYTYLTISVVNRIINTEE